jgi:hypothetical protein
LWTLCLLCVQIDAKPSLPHGEHSSPKSKKIFVGGLAPETTEGERVLRASIPATSGSNGSSRRRQQQPAAAAAAAAAARHLSDSNSSGALLGTGGLWPMSAFFPLSRPKQLPQQAPATAATAAAGHPSSSRTPLAPPLTLTVLAAAFHSALLLPCFALFLPFSYRVVPSVL